jgi:uncharacterized protein YbbC (DUF1343 family)
MGKVRSGLEVVVKSGGEVLRGKRLGIITNHTGVLEDGTHIVDALLGLEGLEVGVLFGPEHGIRGNHAAGAVVESGRDTKTGVPVHSLYGKTKKPTSKMLEGLDALVYDIQDIGLRFYTYVWTMALAMEAAAEQGLEFIVLDRPNPLTGAILEGNLLDPSFASFVGLHPVLIRYGLTAGELARLLNGERMLARRRQVRLEIVPLEGWTREMWYDETALPWVSPSPNIPDLNTAIVFAGTCIFEGTNVSEGRGTPRPFRSITAPWINGPKLAEVMRSEGLRGVEFEPLVVTPKPFPGCEAQPEFYTTECHGVALTITDRREFQPLLSALMLLAHIRSLHREKFQWHPQHFNHLMGNDAVLKAIEAGQGAAAIISEWAADQERFDTFRRRYFLY